LRLGEPPLLGEPLAQALVALRRVEHAADDELRGDGAVPVVGLQPEEDVVPADGAEPVELGSEAERDRTARVAPAVFDTETEVLAVADRCEVAELARG